MHKQRKSQAYLKVLNKKQWLEIISNQMTEMFLDSLKDLGDTFIEHKKSQDHIVRILFNKKINKLINQSSPKVGMGAGSHLL